MSKRIENDLDDLFVEWKSKMKEQDSTSHFTRDGLMYNKNPLGQNEGAWFSSRNRILFLLKDQNQDGAEKWDEDIREWLIDTEKDTDKHHKTKEANRNLETPFLRNLAFLLWGLSKADKDNPWWYGEVAQHFDEVKDFFNTQPFAIVECKKQPGDGKLDDKELKWHLRNYGDFLKREIEILAPTMIVCASQHIYRFVLDMFPQEELTSIGKDHNSIRLHKPTGVLIFCSYHPSAYTKSVEEIYDSVLYHYRAFLEGHY